MWNRQCRDIDGDVTKCLHQCRKTSPAPEPAVPRRRVGRFGGEFFLARRGSLHRWKRSWADIVNGVFANAQTHRLVCENRLESRSIADSALVVVGRERFFYGVVR